MNRLEFENLSEILKCRYPHICITMNDIYVFRASPILNKNYYPFRRGGSRKSGVYIFDGHQTIIWQDKMFGGIEDGYIKISTGEIKVNQNFDTEGWGPTFSFKEEGSPLAIYKTMKMKAFW
jgi:hypothetical protein